MHFIVERIEQTESYLKILERSFTVEWETAYVASKTEADWKVRMALIHPEHYSAHAREDQDCPVRGVRSFPREVGMQDKPCSSKNIWGYDCHMDGNHGTLAGDHLFPFGFGGPTVASNKIFLCQLHNMIKGADLHFFPWEKAEPQWLSDTLRRVAISKGIPA